MSKAVSDSTVLIYLGKIEMLELLEEYEKIVIPKEIEKEVVVKGKEKEAKDAYLVEQKIEEGLIEVVDNPDDKQKIKEYNLEKGEISALSLAIKEKTSLLADEENVREVARKHGIETRGTLYFLFKSLKTGKLDLDSYLEKLEHLSEHGFRMDDKLYFKAVRKGKKISEEEK